MKMSEPTIDAINLRLRSVLYECTKSTKFKTGKFGKITLRSLHTKYHYNTIILYYYNS